MNKWTWLLIICISALICSTPVNARLWVFELVQLDDDFQETTKALTPWKSCGHFFAVAETMRGKAVRLSYYRKISAGMGVKGFLTAPVAALQFEQNVSVFAPVVKVTDAGDVVAVAMNVVDYLTVLPCVFRNG